MSQVATPTITPDGGSFTSSTRAVLACSTTGSSISFTLNGNVPTSRDTVYSSPIYVGNNMTIKAIGWLDGYTDSTVKSSDFVVYAANPTISPNGGAFSILQLVTLSCSTTGSSIYYTKNGTVPTTGSSLYSAPVYIDATTTIVAKAFKTGLSASNSITAVFTEGIIAPSITPNGGNFALSTTVALSGSTGSTLYYTLDGSDPTDSSTLYELSFDVTSSCQLKAIAYLGTNYSAVTSADFGVYAFMSRVSTGGVGRGSPRRIRATKPIMWTSGFGKK